MNQLLTHEGVAHSTPAGRYSVNVINNGTAAGQHLYRVTVTVPSFTPQPAFGRENDRPFGHTDQAQAQQLAERYAAGLVELFTVEAEGITDERIAEVAQGVNAAMVERKPVDVSDELVNPAESWDAFRQQATATAATTTDAMDHILATAAANNGVITRGGDDGEATSTQLVALKKRGLVELVHTKHGNRRVLTGGRLTAKGWKRAGVEQGQVAA